MTTKVLITNIIWKHFYIILFLSFSMNYCQFGDQFSNIDSCFEEEEKLFLNNTICFNNILKFDQKKYQLNNFAKNENDDILIQFSEYKKDDKLSSSRLFYGLSKDGRYFFSNKSSYSIEFNVDIDEETFCENEFYYINEIKNSKSLFVSITPNKGNQYLFNINSYNSMVELFDLNNDNNNYFIWSFHKFFKLDPDDYFFPFDYELFEIKERLEYIIVFIPKIYVYYEIFNVSFMKRFSFQSFDSNAYKEIGLVTYQDYLDNKIINVFLMDDSKTLGVVYINETKIEEYNVNIPIRRRLSDYKINLKFYNSNLKPLSYIKDVELTGEFNEHYQSQDLVIKSLYLNILNKPFVFFVYYVYNSYCFLFLMFNVNLEDFNDKENIISPFHWPLLKEVSSYFDIEKSPNDFIKIKDNQVAFMFVVQQNSIKLEIILIDIDIDLYSREYSINLMNYFPNQIQGFRYNGYFSFSVTGNINNNIYIILII